MSEVPAIYRTIYMRFADNGNMRKWSTKPFDGGTEYRAVPDTLASSAEELAEAVKAEIKELTEISNDSAAPGREAEVMCQTIHLNLLDVMFRLQQAISMESIMTRKDNGLLADAGPVSSSVCRELLHRAENLLIAIGTERDTEACEALLKLKEAVESARTATPEDTQPEANPTQRSKSND